MTKKKFDFESDAKVLKMLKKQLSASHELIEYITSLRAAYTELKNEKSQVPSLPGKPASEFKNYKTPEERLLLAEVERVNKIVSKDQVIEEGQYGDIWDLTRVQNASDLQHRFDFYHHCPQMQDDLVRLYYSEDKDEHTCQFCTQVFLSKYPPPGLGRL